jgi:muramoyltetrapeptide carboxypeptidase
MRIAIVAPARKISMRELKPAFKECRDRGHEVVLGSHLLDESCQFAGGDDERASDFQKMLDDESIDVIWCARGGYGSVRIIDRLDFSRFVTKARWIAGFSDITVFHSHLHQQYGIPSLHSIMPLNIVRGKKAALRREAVDSFFNILEGRDPQYIFGGHPLNRQGESRGNLCGGNLSILYSLLGSRSDIDTRGKILFIEDLDEYLYHVDRMIMALKRAGKFEGLKALLVGHMGPMRDNKVPFGRTAEEIIAGHVAEYDFPVCFGFPAGHMDDNRALILGAETRLKTSVHASEINIKLPR